MENDLEKLCKNLKNNIILLVTLITNELGYNPYKELDKSLTIINQKNYKHFFSIHKKMKELSVLLYDRRLYNNEIEDVLKNIEILLKNFLEKI